VALSSIGRPRVVEGLRLLGIVGQGGEGEVWEARDARGRRRALKLVRPDCLAEPDEAAIRGAWLERIEHPALVRVHRSGVLADLAGDHPLWGWGFVEMDFIDGTTLARVPADPGVVDRLDGLAEALDLLHAGLWSDGVPLVHRDVKPANIVATPDGRFVLVDPSTLRGADATHLTRVGTPVFNAPEVATGRIGPPADVYSFAATVVALATGLRGAALADALEDRHRLDLPGGVRLALSERPGDRPISCRDVLQESATITIALPVTIARPDSDDDWTDTALLVGGDGTQVLDAPVRGGTDVLDAPPYGAPAPWDPSEAGRAPLEAGRAPLSRERTRVMGRSPRPADAAAWSAVGLDPMAPPPGAALAPYAEPAPAPRGPDGSARPPGPGGWPPPGWLRRRVTAPWVLLLLLVSAVASFAGVAGATLDPALGIVPPWPLPPTLGQPAVLLTAGAVGVHLVAHLLAGRWFVWSLLLPPLAWASLLANRVGGTRRRQAWTRAVTVVGATGLCAAPVVAWTAPFGGAPGGLDPVSLWSVGAAVVLAGVAGARGRSAAAGLARALLLPAWAVGAVVLAGLALLVTPLALFVGLAPRLVRAAGTTLASVLETGRGPGPARWPTPPTAHIQEYL